MAIDDVCDPNKNEYFAGMLKGVGFDYNGLKIREFTNPQTKVVSGVMLLRDKSDMVFVLLPDLGTSVLEHPREKSEKVHYLGPIASGESSTSPRLSYKFQNNSDEKRVEKVNDVVRDYRPGDEFDTMGNGINGRWHGYHNPDPKNPIALRIQKTF